MVKTAQGRSINHPSPEGEGLGEGLSGESRFALLSGFKKGLGEGSIRDLQRGLSRTRAG